VWDRVSDPVGRPEGPQLLFLSSFVAVLRTA